jgi:uncharacterized membrane protein
MSWLQRYRVRAYFRNSIWILPTLSMLAALAAARLLHAIEEVSGWEAGFHPDTARAVLGTMAASMFTFVVFVSSALLVAVQLASAQLTPRIIAVVFRDPITRLSLTVFVFTFTFSLAALVRITGHVPLLTAQLAAYSSLVCLGLFLYLIDHVGKALRPSGALQAVARLGRAAIEKVFPRPLAGSQDSPPSPAADPGLNRTPTAVIASPHEGVVLAFDIRGLVSLAQGADCVIELVPQVGDLVAAGDPLFRVFGGKSAPPAAAFCQSVAVGMERTVEQDPAFVFRILVDIASKGLSPAINDPTTAVLVLDQIHHLLRAVGRRRLDEGQVCDAAGRLRLVYRTPDWDDFVHLAVTEIRQFGGSSIQVIRRLRAMLENLIATLPPTRVALLRGELSLLQRLAERFFPEPEDRALADVSDSQGVGGAPGLCQGRRDAQPGTGLPAPRSAPRDGVPTEPGGVPQPRQRSIGS